MYCTTDYPPLRKHENKKMKKNEVHDGASVHVFDFKFKGDELSENLNFAVTNELVRYFGNPSYYVDRKECNTTAGTAGSGRNSNLNNESQQAGSSSASSSSTSDNRKTKDTKDGPGVDVHHRVINNAQLENTVVKTVLNRKYLGILFEDGTVQRAGCQCADNRASKCGSSNR